MAINPPKVFHGQEAVVEIGDSITVSASNELKDQMNNQTDFSGIIMDITITDPEASVEIQNTFGGQIKTESPYELVTFDFTVRFNDIEMMEQLHESASTLTGVSFSGTWHRISGSATIGDKPEKAILFKLAKPDGSGGTYKLHYLANNAIFQQMGEISLEGDGTAEMTGTAVCLMQDRYIEKNF